jgi:hypothetical protein
MNPALIEGIPVLIGAIRKLLSTMNRCSFRRTKPKFVAKEVRSKMPNLERLHARVPVSLHTADFCIK